MRFGAYALPSYHADTDGSPGEFMRQLVDLLASAEPLGFDAIWLNEHHFHAFGGMIPSPPMMLSALAQRTQRVTLGTSITVLPLHNPVELAEQLAMLDLMSDGRLQLGIGRGSVGYDHAALGLTYHDAQERMIDGLQVIMKAWSGRPFSHHSPFYNFADLSVWPPGQQQPAPPIWISCSRSPASFEWTGRRGFNLLTVGFINTVARTAELTRIYRDASDEPSACEIGTLYHVVVAENGRRAREQALGAFRRFRVEMAGAHARNKAGEDDVMPVNVANSLNVDQLIDEGRLIAGNPDEVADMFRYLQGEIGFTEVELMFQLGGLSFEVAYESMQLFATEVMPSLRQPASVPA